MPTRYGDDLGDDCRKPRRSFRAAGKTISSRFSAVFWAFVLRPPPTGSSLPMRYPPRPTSKSATAATAFVAFAPFLISEAATAVFPTKRFVRPSQSARSEGVREITLIAQDTGRWGEDFENPSTTARLLDGLASEFSDTWFRLMYIEPQGVTDELLDVISAHDNVCSYLDVPLQHASESVLRAMNRRMAKSHRELIERIRLRVPDITLRTTLIAGFPGRRRRISRSSANSLKRSNSITSACSRTLGRKALVRRIPRPS